MTLSAPGARQCLPLILSKMCRQRIAAFDTADRFAPISTFEIDRSLAPRGTVWWAMNGDETASWHLSPIVAEEDADYLDYWECERVAASIFDFTGEWWDSLHAHPRASIPN